MENQRLSSGSRLDAAKGFIGNNFAAVFMFGLTVMMAIGLTIYFDFNGVFFPNYVDFILYGLFFLHYFSKGYKKGLYDVKYNASLKIFIEKSKGINIPTFKKFLAEYPHKRRKEYETILIRMTGLTKNEVNKLSRKEMKKRGIPRNLRRMCIRIRKPKGRKLAFKTPFHVLQLRKFDINRFHEMGPNASRNYNIRTIMLRLLSLAIKFMLVGFIVTEMHNYGLYGSVMFFLFYTYMLLSVIMIGYLAGKKSITFYRYATLETAIKYLDRCEEFATKNNLEFKYADDLTEVEGNNIP